MASTNCLRLRRRFVMNFRVRKVTPSSEDLKLAGTWENWWWCEVHWEIFLERRKKSSSIHPSPQIRNTKAKRAQRNPIEPQEPRNRSLGGLGVHTILDNEGRWKRASSWLTAMVRTDKTVLADRGRSASSISSPQSGDRLSLELLQDSVC